MKLIIDANVIISAVLKNGRTRELLLDDSLELYAPLFIKEEVMKYKSYMAKKTRTTPSELERFVDELLALAEITFVHDALIRDYIDIAKRISPDPKDVIYLALALFEVCPLWSNDKPLKQRQGVIKIITTPELYGLIK